MECIFVVVEYIRNKQQQEKEEIKKPKAISFHQYPTSTQRVLVYAMVLLLLSLHTHTDIQTDT